MNLFDQLVMQALEVNPQLAPLRIVVEKELLHHDILRILENEGMLSDLTFIGGTCLRLCYGGVRLSEDLDFTGGKDFSRTTLMHMGKLLVEHLKEKYMLKVAVSEPNKEKLNVDTWKIKIETKPEAKHLPAQRINIDICSVTSYDKASALLINHYGIDTGTSGLVIQAQTKEEIFADKLIAFAYRPNRIKYRDIWDIMWLYQQGVKPLLSLIPDKLKERHHTLSHFTQLFDTRLQLLKHTSEMATEFKDEMRRFLPTEQMKTIEKDHVFLGIMQLLTDLHTQMANTL